MLPQFVMAESVSFVTPGSLPAHSADTNAGSQAQPADMLCPGHCGCREAPLASGSTTSTLRLQTPPSVSWGAGLPQMSTTVLNEREVSEK